MSPDKDDDEVFINQNAWFYLANFDADYSINYIVNCAKNGVYIFNISGDIMVNDVALHTMDGFGIWNVESIVLTAQTQAEFLIMEVPMQNG